MSTQRVIGSAATIAIFAFVSFVTLSAARTKAVRAGGIVDFGAPPAIRVLSILLPLGFLSAFLLVLFLRPFEYGSLTLLVVGILALFGVPSELKVSPEGVYEKYWWKPAKTMGWKEVETVNYNTSSGSIELRSFGGTKIAHSRLNRDRDEFAQICRKYTKSKGT